MPRTRRIVVGVLWLDTQFALDHPGVKPLPMVTYGEVVEETPEYIRLRGEVHANGTGRDYNAIPMGVVKQIIRIGSFLEPREFAGYMETAEDVG